MTPVALWTARLPGLRRLPRKRSLWIIAPMIVVGLLGGFGVFGREGCSLAILTILAAAWTVWRHRWPTELPIRLRSLERPHGPDERAVMVEIRQKGYLLGWDVGILWFEKGGFGFVGRTVSFVVPRAIMHDVSNQTFFQSAFRAPQFTATVFETAVGIVPLAPELRAEMTLARIDALPESVTSETILPPTEMHPDLVQRGVEVRRRMPILYAAMAASLWVTLLPTALAIPGHRLPRLITTVFGVLVMLYAVAYGAALPGEISRRLPPGRRRKF